MYVPKTDVFHFIVVLVNNSDVLNEPVERLPRIGASSRWWCLVAVTPR